MNKKILVIDDEESIRWILKKGLEKKGYALELAKDGNEGREALFRSEYLIAFVDIMLPGASGIDLLKETREAGRKTPVIVMTAQGTMKNAIDAMREGAYDYITKPFDMEEIYQTVKKVEEIERLEERVNVLEEELKTRFVPDEIVGGSRAMEEVFKNIGKVASSDLTVLITGESGTGKELVTRALHKNSRRASNPFVAVNCAAIPKDLLESELFGFEKGAFTGAVDSRKGKFELANGGTLFLDEIGEIEIGLQSKLLRAIQEQEFYRVGGKSPVKVDTRIVAATNQKLEEAVAAKTFREDLYHRLNVFTITIPPLRERKEDVADLARYFVKRFGREMGVGDKNLSQEALQRLLSYSWEGNVRELQNVIKRALVFTTGSTIMPESLPARIWPEGEEVQGGALKDFVSGFLMGGAEEGDIYNAVISEVERELFKGALNGCNWNQVKTAKKLGINRNTLARKIKELHIEQKS